MLLFHTYVILRPKSSLRKCGTIAIGSDGGTNLASCTWIFFSPLLLTTWLERNTTYAHIVLPHCQLCFRDARKQKRMQSRRFASGRALRCRCSSERNRPAARCVSTSPSLSRQQACTVPTSASHALVETASRAASAASRTCRATRSRRARV